MMSSFFTITCRCAMRRAEIAKQLDSVAGKP